MPIYKTLRDCVVGATWYHAGIKVSFAGWPKAFDLEPLDDAARRIAEYFARHAQNPWLRRSPYDARTDSFYLPAEFTSTYHDKAFTGAVRAPSIVPDDATLEGMPRYRVPYARRFGSFEVPNDAVVTFLAWPLDAYGLVPVNEAAREVVDYMRAAIEQRKFGPGWEALVQAVPSPWNHFDDALYLPDAAAVLAAEREAA